MPLFRYSGYTRQGAEAKGSLEASGIRDALARMREEGIFPREVREEGHGGRASVRADRESLATVTRQISILLSSGVPLIDALQSLADEHQGAARHMLLAVKERVSGGAALHKALGEYGAFFPDFYLSMVQAGEASGTLDKVLGRLAEYLEREGAVRAKVRIALTYPLFMVAVSMVVMSFLFTFVIPKIVRIFSEAKSALPFITTVLISVSNAFVHYWWAMLAACVVISLVLKRVPRSRRHVIDALFIRLPGNIVQSLYYGRFARTLAFLLDGGLPMLQALTLAAGSTGNRAVEAAVLSAKEKVAEGGRLSASLKGFPPLFVQLIATGERSGRLSETLTRAADAYEDAFSRKVDRAVSLFEPAMILMMGIVVGFIVLAVLLPLFQLNQLIK
jgi:general secretion pathway protein F